MSYRSRKSKNPQPHAVVDLHGGGEGSIQFLIEMADEECSTMTFLEVELNCVLSPLRYLPRDRTPMSFLGLGDSPFYSPNETRLFHVGFLCRDSIFGSGVSHS